MDQREGRWGWDNRQGPQTGCEIGGVEDIGVSAKWHTVYAYAAFLHDHIPYFFRVDLMWESSAQLYLYVHK